MNRQSILLVEDEAQQREMLQLVLESEGYNVVGAETAEEALQHLSSNKPNMLITDVKLPGIDGFTLFDEVRKSNDIRQFPIIFITAYNDSKSAEHMKQFGASAYVTKPYNLEDLLKLVKELLPQ